MPYSNFKADKNSSKESQFPKSFKKFVKLFFFNLTIFLGNLWCFLLYFSKPTWGRFLYPCCTFFFQFSAFIKFAQKDDKRDYSRTISYPPECNLSKQKENTYRIVECCIGLKLTNVTREFEPLLTFVAPKLISESPWKASMSTTCHCLSNTMPKRKEKSLETSRADSAD